MDHEAFAEDVLALGLGDDVSFSEITGLALRKYVPDGPLEAVRDDSLKVVEGLVHDGLARVGTLDERGAFVDRNDELRALTRDVFAAYDGDQRGPWRDMLWLRNTPAGDRRAESVPEGHNPFDEDRRGL